MSTTTATKITYRKNRAGTWVAYGPAAAIKAGADVEVTLKGGDTETRTVRSAGKAFVVDGVKMVYGYLAERTAEQEASRDYYRNLYSTSRPTYPAASTARVVDYRSGSTGDRPTYMDNGATQIWD